MFSVPTVRDVVSMVTVRAAVISNVKPTVSPAAVPGTVGLELQLVAALQMLDALFVQFPLSAGLFTAASRVAAAIKAYFISILDSMYECVIHAKKRKTIFRFIYRGRLTRSAGQDSISVLPEAAGVTTTG